MTRIWQLQEAKNKLSEVVNAAVMGVPQIITRHGEQVAVVMSFGEYARLAQPKTNLVLFFRNSPLAQIELDWGRDRSLPRDGVSM